MDARALGFVFRSSRSQWTRASRASRALVVGTMVALAGCKNDAERYLSVESVTLERGEGIPLTAGGAAPIGHSVYVAGSLTNTHASKTAFNVHLEVKLFRNAGDAKPARIYEEYSIAGLEHVGPGQKAAFRHYVKTSLGGYDRCEVRPVSATFQ